MAVKLVGREAECKPIIQIANNSLQIIFYLINSMNTCMLLPNAKNISILLIFFMIFPISNVYSLDSKNTIIQNYDLILCGIVSSKLPSGSEISGPIYKIEIINFYQGSLSNFTLTAIGSEDTNGPRSMKPLNIGEKAIFYVNEINNHYILSPFSVKIPQCSNKFNSSPLGQSRIGIEPNDVQCSIPFELAIKKNDNTPACVTPETKLILIERGWAKSKS